jgi:hypothetical protein
MEVFVNRDSINTCFTGNPGGITITEVEISNLIKRNLAFNSKSDKFFMSVVVRKVNAEEGGVWLALSLCTLTLINFLGFPADSFKWDIYLEAAIMNQDGKVLKIYSAKGTDTEYWALYWGFPILVDKSNLDGGKTACFNAILAACEDLRNQIMRDAENIRIMTQKGAGL